MQPLRYSSGDLVQLGDIVALGNPSGPQLRVVVLIAAGQAVVGFQAAEWAYLERGAMLQDTAVFGLLHVEEFDAEYVMLSRMGLSSGSL